MTTSHLKMEKEQLPELLYIFKKLGSGQCQTLYWYNDTTSITKLNLPYFLVFSVGNFNKYVVVLLIIFSQLSLGISFLEEYT